jgi:two-component system KDP operon response regulator KdpE
MVVAPPREGSALVIDDEPPIRRVVRKALEEQFAEVLEADSGSRGIDLAAAAMPRLVILDLGLPDLQGVDVCREIRRFTSAPIIVLSARHSDREKAFLLDAGADDYVTKPFSTLELTARVRAHLRRIAAPPPLPDEPLMIGDLVVDLDKRTVRRGGEPLHLTPIEWGLLRFFIAQAGRTLTHQQLFRGVWGRAYGDAQHNLRVHVANLRRKIEVDPVRPRLILTEPGVGYRFELPE